MPNIYISYATADEPLIRELSSRLEESGHSVFYSGGSLNVGQLWADEISKSLRNADAVVIVVSDDSLKSRWLMAEMGAALGYFQERGRPLVLPVVIGEAELPVQLAQIQAIFSPDRNVPKIASQIDSALSAMRGRLHAREDERRATQEHVEEKASHYIRESLDELRKKDLRYKSCSVACYGGACLALLAGIWFALSRVVLGPRLQPSATWEAVVQYSIGSVVVIALFGALSRFAFVLGKSFMVESLRTADRIHAIKFGYFYLQAFGAKAEWSEIKEAFQHWNIDTGSSFISQTAADIDPQIIQTAIELAKAVAGKGKSKE